ncbi:MAG: FadR family transcriptional regulator [Planctomycetota bacterium]|jgi:GntR family transcriptional repressor for pyruvate dehydrogenase complex|nr:FadR family transcriptional regulator [Planctomycetota bacterium]
MLKKVSKKTIASQVINQLTDLIRNGKLQPGDRLPPEREMAEQLGVSRPPLRESLRALEYAGVIETRYGDGIYVKSADFPMESGFSTFLNQYTLEEMIEMRKVVEKAAVRFASERASGEDLETLREIQERTKASVDDMERFIECDFAFHSAIAEAARNSMLFETMKTMRRLMAEFNRELLQSRAFRAGVARQHDVVLNAVTKGDAEMAVEAMDRHLDNVVDLARDRNRRESARRHSEKAQNEKRRKSG